MAACLYQDSRVDTLLNSCTLVSVVKALRRQFSASKGGRFAQAAHPEKAVATVVADATGDYLAQAASGPTIKSDLSRDDALNLMKVWGIFLPPRLAQWLETNAPRSQFIQNSSFARDEWITITSVRKSLEADADRPKELEMLAATLSNQIQVEAKEIAPKYQPFQPPAALLSSGETSVTFAQSGKGERILQFALSLVLTGIEVAFPALFSDKDRIESSEDSRVAFVSGQSVRRFKSLGLSPDGFLANHDSGTAFEALADFFKQSVKGINAHRFRANSTHYFGAQRGLSNLPL